MKKNTYTLINNVLLIIILFLVSNCIVKDDVEKIKFIQIGKLKISSPAFEDHGFIPTEYTYDGINVNPPLLIESVPAEAKSLVLIIDGFNPPLNSYEVLWLLYNINPDTSEIKENTVPKGSKQLKNSFNDYNYRGSCPEVDSLGTYFFKLHALNQVLDLSLNATLADLKNAMKGHIIAHTQIKGIYGTPFRESR